MFVRGGNVGPGDALYGAGNDGDYWSSVSYNSSLAYSLLFDPNAVSPSNRRLRHIGFSLRCVALGS